MKLNFGILLISTITCSLSLSTTNIEKIPGQIETLFKSLSACHFQFLLSDGGITESEIEIEIGWSRRSPRLILDFDSYTTSIPLDVLEMEYDKIPFGPYFGKNTICRVQVVHMSPSNKNPRDVIWTGLLGNNKQDLYIIFSGVWMHVQERVKNFIDLYNVDGLQSPVLEIYDGSISLWCVFCGKQLTLDIPQEYHFQGIKDINRLWYDAHRNRNGAKVFANDVSYDLNDLIRDYSNTCEPFLLWDAKWFNEHIWRTRHHAVEPRICAAMEMADKFNPEPMRVDLLPVPFTTYAVFISSALVMFELELVAAL